MSTGSPKIRVSVQYDNGTPVEYAADTRIPGEPADGEPGAIADMIELLSQLCAKDLITELHEAGTIIGPVPDNFLYSRTNGRLEVYDWQTRTWRTAEDSKHTIDMLLDDEEYYDRL
jgi:hypothetical protein